MEYNYKKCLMRRVRLSWTSSSNQQGFLSLSNCRVSFDMVRKLLPAPIVLSFVAQYNRDGWFRDAVVGSLVSIECRVKNATQLTLSETLVGLQLLELSLEDAVRGGLMCLSGDAKRSVQSMAAGEEVSVVFEVCFLVPMEFRFELRCEGEHVAPYTVPAQLSVCAKKET